MMTTMTTFPAACAFPLCRTAPRARVLLPKVAISTRLPRDPGSDKRGTGQSRRDPVISCTRAAGCRGKGRLAEYLIRGYWKMGIKTGRPRGRPKGAKNKRTAKREAALQAAAEQIGAAIPEPFQGDAHAYLMLIYKDPAQETAVRIDAAKAALPYEKPRLAP